ncbi:MAG: glycosyltransferase [Dysgonamonadaceae bacterium]|jgi:glycosyltransferase involved in cell wall biosynthesis|nr:glycosyltransferase [Dysgonamonadaceae bacterium]
MTSPLVSIILPNYNHAHFLNKRIDSILQQTYQNFELIILDDCSTDYSAEIIKSYLPSKKISHTIFNEKNSGSTFLQWQKGFSFAKGKYVWIAESDDYSDLTFLEKMVSLLENNEDCCIAFCHSHLIDENDKILDLDWDRNSQQYATALLMDSQEFVEKRMLFDNSIYNAGMVVFRRSSLEKIGNGYAEYKFCGDWYLWKELCLQGATVIRLSEKLNYFRQHQSKVSPKAVLEGLSFTEGKYIFKDTLERLNYSLLKKRVAIGYFLKRIRLRTKYFKDKATKTRVYLDSKEFLRGSYADVVFYKADRKLFKCRFSGLNIEKNWLF